MHRPPEDIRLSFNQVPAVYDRVRPGYPPQFFDVMFADLGSTPSILEVGPGTGQATVDLLRRGARVTAVEIGSDLASFLRTKFADRPVKEGGPVQPSHPGQPSSNTGQPSLRVLNSAFEDLPPNLGPFDAVVSATAYHWVAEAQRMTHPHRFLRSGGLLAVISLTHVQAPSDRGYFDRVQPIYESFGDSRHDWTPPTHETARPSIIDEMEQSPLYSNVEVHRAAWDQTYTSVQYRDLLLSYSGTQMMPEPHRSRLVDQLVAVVDTEFGGTVTRPLAATLTMGRAVPDRAAPR